MALHKETYGLGEPIVMLHGWAMHTGVWRKFALQLAEQYQVTCLDLPGHGRSAGIDPYTLDTVADKIVKELPGRSCTLVGWSLGGNIALRLAEKYPQRIKSIVLIATNPHFIETKSWPGMSLRVLRQFVQNLHNKPAQTLLRFMNLQVQGLPHAKLVVQQTNEALRECVAPTAKVLIRALLILQTLDQREALQHLTMPLLMIAGTMDSIVPIQVGRQCQLLQPNIELYELVSAGHLPFIAEQEQVVSWIGEFILKCHAHSMDQT